MMIVMKLKKKCIENSFPSFETFNDRSYLDSILDFIAKFSYMLIFDRCCAIIRRREIEKNNKTK